MCGMRWVLRSLTVALASGILLSGPVRAQEADAEPAPSDAAKPQAAREVEASPSAGTRTRPGLGSLLRPRSTRPYTESAPQREGRGERDRAEWRQAFAEAREQIVTIETRLEEARVQVAEAAGGSAYQYTPLGGTDGQGPSDPEVLKIRAQIKRDKRELEEAERRFRDLQVEASLAGVPADWIESIRPDR